MPKIVRFHALGEPDVLKIEDMPARHPGRGEVRLKVQATGLNRAESMFYHGQYLETPQLPARIGYEAAGVVDELGDGVDQAWLGKQVATIPAFGMNAYGVLGEEAIVPAAALGAYPPKLSAAEGAAIWMQYLTAYGALIELGKLANGEAVLITAASSSVGLAAIQIAKAEGATSIAATRTSAKKAELIALGAHHVVVTDEEDLPARVMEITGGKGARIVFDPVGGPALPSLAAATSPQGIIFEYGALSTEPTPFPLFEVLGRRLTIRGYTLMEITSVPERLAAATKYVYDRLDDGRFHPKIARMFPFAQTVDAYRYLESNAQVGKVVIAVP